MWLFFLKRIGDNSVDLKTPGCLQKEIKTRCLENESVLLDDIGLVYGNDCKKELQRISLDFDQQFKFEMNGYASNSKYTQLRQMVFVLFINERLVDCQPIRKAVHSVYTLYMPKNTNYFVYMNLVMNPNNLDVNIHPTKHEVRFLYQDEIINKIQTCFEEKMLNSSVSRTYCAKNLTLDTFIETKRVGNNSLVENSENNESQVKLYPYQMTRVDHKERKIDTYLKTTSNNESISDINQSLNESKTLKPTYNKETKLFSSGLRANTREDINFKSLDQLKSKIEKSASKTVHEILQSMNFVGFIHKELSLIQHQTALYLANTRRLSEELFYQLALFNFGNFGYYKLSETCLISELAMMALDNPESEWSPDDGPKERLSTRCGSFLKNKAKMLDDYFSIKILIQKDENNVEKIYLESLPILLDNYEPDMNDLPLFIIRLATEVNWKNEKECFDSICRQLAWFFSSKNPIEIDEEDINIEQVISDSNSQKSINSCSSSQNKNQDSWITEHVIYTAFRNMLLVTEDFEKESFFKLVDLSRLYRVFERC